MDSCRQKECGLSFSDILLDKEPWVARCDLAPEFIGDVQSRTYMDDIAKRMVLELRKDVLTHRVAESSYTTRVPVPASWWQHLKHQYRDHPLLGWLSKRFPVRFEDRVVTYSFSKRVRFPESTMKLPDSLGPVIVAEQVEPEWSARAGR